jgi:predicted nucleic acid-binding protein
VLVTSRYVLAAREIEQPDVELHVPGVCDVELVSVLRRGLRSGRLVEARAALALLNYLDLDIQRHGHAALLTRILELRDNFTAYDASYVALAERLQARVLTGDAALGSAIARHTPLEVLVLS